MNWFKTHVQKFAFPYGRIKCPKCKHIFLNDFGYKDVLQGNKSSTQDVDSSPFIEHNSVSYETPLHDFNDEVSGDETERGTIVVQCPLTGCSQWLRVEYEMNSSDFTPEQKADFFAQVQMLEIDPISDQEAQGYMSVGMNKGYAIAD